MRLFQTSVNMVGIADGIPTNVNIAESIMVKGETGDVTTNIKVREIQRTL